MRGNVVNGAWAWLEWSDKVGFADTLASTGKTTKAAHTFKNRKAGNLTKGGTFIVN